MADANPQAAQTSGSMEPEDRIQTAGPFLRLRSSTWVRYDAILVIHARNYPDADGNALVGSEVVIASPSTGPAARFSAFAVWSEQPPERIMAAVRNVAARTERVIGYERSIGMRQA